MPFLPPADADVLRELAKEYAEIIADPAQGEKIALWTRFNRMDPARPMVRCSNSAWNETLPAGDFVCTDPLAQQHERFFRYHLYMWRHLKDDFVFDDAIYVPLVVRQGSWGVETHAVRPDHVFGAAHFEPVIREEADSDKLRIPYTEIDWVETEWQLNGTRELYDGILPVRTRGVCGFWFAIFDQYIQWRGLEQAFADMYDRPEWLHRILALMTDGMIAHVEALEAAGALGLNNGSNGTQAAGPNGLAFTDALPAPDFAGVVRPKDMWGHATTQIFADVSPAMHEEFALQYEARFLARFGLATYGCCEPLHRKVDLLFKHIPHLRRVSMSPWVDVPAGAAALGRRAIFSYKPNPAVFAGETWDPAAVRAGLRQVLDQTRGCVVEIIMKDLHHCHWHPERLTEWTEIAMQVAEEYAYT
jgi:hypothetical protein